MKKKISFIFVFCFLCLKVFSQDLCTIQNTEVLGVGGGAWLRQSFTPTEDISHPYVSMPIYAPISTFMIRISLYQGSVWDQNPILIDQTVEGPVIVNSDDWWPNVLWFGISIPNVTLSAGQQYFLEIQDDAENISVFSFGQAGFQDLFPGGEQRDPFTSQTTTNVWFSDIAIRVQGNCGDICLGDFDNDGLVGVNDLIIFLSTFGCVENCFEQDFNNDLVVGAADLVFFMSLFGSVCE